MCENPDGKSFPSFVKWGLVFIVTAWLVWAYMALHGKPDIVILNDLNTGKPDLTARGQFGDTFGALNALFTGLALLGVAYSIHLQKEDSRDRDLSDRRRSFEEHYFRVTESFRRFVSEIKVTPNSAMPSSSLTGPKALDYMYSEIHKVWAYDCVVGRAQDSLESFYSYYSKLFDADLEDNGTLAAYYRIIYQIFKCIHNSPVSDKTLYSSLIRAELSSGELALLALNARSADGELFVPFYSEFAILEHLPKEKLSPAVYADLEKRLGLGAFGKN